MTQQTFRKTIFLCFWDFFFLFFFIYNFLNEFSKKYWVTALVRSMTFIHKVWTKELSIFLVVKPQIGVQALPCHTREGVYLLLAAEATDHAVGKHHLVVLRVIVAHVTRVRLTTTRKPARHNQHGRYITAYIQGAPQYVKSIFVTHLIYYLKIKLPNISYDSLSFSMFSCKVLAQNIV